jgi:predicted ArsR family transcriptional regulator
VSAVRAARGETRQAVFDLLVREADMDGLVIVTEREIGEVLGITQTAAGFHVRALMAEGLLGYAGLTGPRGTTRILQLAEEVDA